MAQTNSSHRNILSRCLAAAALIGIYCVSIVGTSALMLASSTTSAEAQRGRGRGGGGRGRGRGRGGGFYRGGGRGRGYGFGPAIVVPRVLGPGCYYSRRYGRTICPY